MKAPGYRLILLLPAGGGPDLTGGTFRLGSPYQTCVLTSIPEVYMPGDPGPDLSGWTDAQRLCKNNVGKDEGSLGVPTP